MSASTRAEIVDAYARQLRVAVRHVPGGMILSRPVLAEIVALVTFVESELGDGCRQLTAKMAALREVLSESAPGRVDATSDASQAIPDLIFEKDVGTAAAAKLLGIKEDSVRKALREKRLAGRRVDGYWRVPLVEIERMRAA